jgi:hypothetical protein
MMYDGISYKCHVQIFNFNASLSKTILLNNSFFLEILYKHIISCYIHIQYGQYHITLYYIILYIVFNVAEAPKKKKKKKKSSSASKKKQKVIKPDATSKAATKSTTAEPTDLSEAILGGDSNKNTMKVGLFIFCY